MPHVGALIGGDVAKATVGDKNKNGRPGIRPCDLTRAGVAFTHHVVKSYLREKA